MPGTLGSARFDVVQISRYLITVLEKRGDGVLEELAGEYLEKWGDPHASSNSASPGLSMVR